MGYLRRRNTSKQKGNKVTAFERMKNWVGPVRMESGLKSWGDSVRKRKVSKDWTRKKEMYAKLRWAGLEDEAFGKGDIVGCA